MDAGCSEPENLNIVDTITYFKFRIPVTTILSLQCEDNTVTNDHRTNKSSLEEKVLIIEHSKYTDIDSVGLQIWNGALLLADFIIHESQSLFAKKKILELSSGTGLLGITVSMFCEHITCTDINEGDILHTIRSNFKRNENLVNSTFTIKEYNFFKKWSSDIENIVDNIEVVLASEAIYDNEITDGFIDSLVKLLTRNPRIFVYISFEKRYVFTLSNLRVEAVHYDYFFQKLNITIEKLKLNWKLQKLEADFPRYFYEYERAKELELWQISAVFSTL